MSPLENAIESVRQLDVLELGKVQAVVSMRIDSLTDSQATPGDSGLKRWWQRLTQPRHYAKARDKENRRLRDEVSKLRRDLQRRGALPIRGE